MPVRPNVVLEIEADLGEGAAQPLIELFGGQKIGIPASPSGSRLEKSLGIKLAGWLSSYRPGEQISIPSLNAARMARTAETRRRYISTNPNLSLNQLASHLEISERRVSQIRREIR